METRQIVKELLFLLIPLIAFIALSLMVSCGRGQGDKYFQKSLSFKDSQKNSYEELRLSQEERKVLADESHRQN